MAITFHDQKSVERLEELHRREEEELAKTLSMKYGVEYTDLTRKSIDADSLRLVPEDEARSAEIAAFKRIGKRLFVAMRAPERSDSLMAIEKIERLGYQVRRFIVSEASLEHAWDRYGDLSFATETEAGVLNVSTETIQKMMEELKTVQDVAEHVDESVESKVSHRISRVFEIIMAGALALGASDIHLEPEEELVRMRYRLDGVLMDILKFDHETYRMVSSRIKLLSGLKLNIKNMAQDGRFSIVANEKEIEIRTSILPGNYAETIVMRVLDPSTIALSMDVLGFDPYLLDVFQEELKKPNGMILNTGPTGSGKTTTLYAFLKYVHTPEIKIITIEDPIEYHLEGLVQTQVSKNYSFAQGLRSTLRQDPDVIMVGEIRDSEVASTAVHAALTGHLVFSTLHTNNAAGTFPRLIDIGVAPDIIGSAVNLAMAQRLVRKLCTHCKEEVPIEGKDRTTVDALLFEMPHSEELPENRTSMWIPKGCEKCGGVGYKGRVAVVEAIRMDEKVEKIVRQTSSERIIWAHARHQNIRRMGQDGVVKVLQGVTSLEELARVVDLEEEVEAQQEIRAMAANGELPATLPEEDTTLPPAHEGLPTAALSQVEATPQEIPESSAPPPLEHPSTPIPESPAPEPEETHTPPEPSTPQQADSFELNIPDLHPGEATLEHITALGPSGTPSPKKLSSAPEPTFDLDSLPDIDPLNPPGPRT